MKVANSWDDIARKTVLFLVVGSIQLC